MICVSLQEQNFEKCKEIVRCAEMVEIRADLCMLNLCELGELMEHSNVLITCRLENCDKEYAYSQIAEAIKLGARFVDIEIEADDTYLDRIKLLIKDNDCKLIISYHNFNDTDSLEQLEAIYNQCIERGADIVKIVTTAHSTQDGVRTLSLYDTDSYKKYGNDSLIAFSMGKEGMFTRHLCLEMGSPYTYVSVDHNSQTASGQYTKEEMENLLSVNTYPFKFGATQPYKLFDKVVIPCSKSVAQRAILAAALSDGVTTFNNFAPCNDINGAIKVVEKLGCNVKIKGSMLTIDGISSDKLKVINKIEVGESGLLTRLLIPFSLYLGGVSKQNIEITGVGSILKRSLSESIDAIERGGGKCVSLGEHNKLPFVVSGDFTESEITFSGRESSQIVSGFLMTLPLLSHNTTLKITNPTSVPYIDLTIRVLAQFGVDVEVVEKSRELLHYHIIGNQKYCATNLYMDADWSSAAPFAVAGAIKGDITLENMTFNSCQADEVIIDVLRGCGVEVELSNSTHNLQEVDFDNSVANLVNVRIFRDSELKPFSFDATNSPDLFPILALLALHCSGRTEIIGVNRLMQKESNRAETVYSEFRKMGGKIDIVGDVMYIEPSKLHGANINSHNDHRIPMSIIMASLFVDSDVNIDNIKCMAKSFPTFLDLLKE